MPKKKKKKGIDKEKKVRKSRHLNEKDTLFYEQEILDNNRQIARLRSRNQELENELEVTKGKLQQLEEDRSDIIAHLKRNLQHKFEEAQELNNRLYALEELREKEITSYKKKEEEMVEEYHTMENNLMTEIQLSAGKLSALEEWRIARNDLMKKFEIQEKQIEEQEKKHKEQLYEVERNTIISKAKLQKEMEERLNQLALNFRETINLRIADSTKRAIFENIAINKELDVMFKICRYMNAKVNDYKRRDYNLSMQAALFQAETISALKKVMKQNRLIKELAEEHYKMKNLREKMKNLEKIAQFNENLACKYENKYQESQKNIQILSQTIEQAKENNRKILENIENNNKDIITLKEVIRRAKECIKTALNLSSEPLIKENMKNLDEKEKFLRTMLDILGSDLYFQTNDQIKEDVIINKYIQGSLGLVCSHSINQSDLIKQDIKDLQRESANEEKNILEDKCGVLCINNKELERSDYFPFDSNTSDELSFDAETDNTE